MPQILILTLEAPLVAYGAEMVDARGPVRDWPGASMLTGLLANALGYTRNMRAEHDRLQDRIDFAVRIDRAGTLMRDFQTAKLEKNDKGWTTRGVPEGRAGASFDSPHIRERDYFADSSVTIALHLRDADEAPTLVQMAQALQEPARPLFLGRKPCLPTVSIFKEMVDAIDLIHALDGADAGEIVISERLGLPASWETLHVTDERNWLTGLHGGERLFRRGRMEGMAT